MKLLFLVLFSFFLIVSCSSKDQQFCDCLKVSDEVNVLGNKLLNKTVSQEDQQALILLRQEKDSICKKYERMGGKEMLELKEACK